jgi:DNA-binding PadR family transcriptional regulator
MAIKHVILGMLSEGPLHGYELKAVFESQIVPDGALNFGQVYTTLERLHRDGLVEHDTVSQSERPDKKVYALTPAGREAVREWLDQPTPQPLDLRHETYLKLTLARHLRSEDPLAVLRAEHRASFARLHELSQAATVAESEQHPLATRLMLDLAVTRLEAFIKWLERCEDAIRLEDSA